MILILGCAVPMMAMALLFMMCRAQTRSGESRFADVQSGPVGPEAVGRWEGLAEQIARLEQRPPRRSDAALRRRHLAAVLPADARR